MKKEFLAIVILFFSINSFCQTSSLRVLTNEGPIGENLITHNSISAMKYTFPDRIYHFDIDIIKGLVAIQLRGVKNGGIYLKNKGRYLVYDLKSQKIRWTNKVNYLTTIIQHSNGKVIQSMLNKSRSFNFEDGNKIWQTNKMIGVVDRVNNIGFGYRGGNFRNLNGVNLNSGVKIWERKLSLEYGWNDVVSLSDTSILVVASGLHSIDVRTGKGWDYNVITGYKDYSGTMAVSILGMAAAVLTGTGFYATGHKLVRNMVSNVIIENDNIYFATRDSISQIDKITGEIRWSYPFTGKWGSKSSLFIKDSLLYIVNYGYADSGMRRINCGTPFIAAYNKETGERRFFSSIIIKNNPIQGYGIKDDTIVLIFRQGISEYSMENGDLISERQIDIKKYGKLVRLVCKNVFTKCADGTYASLCESNKTMKYVLTGRGKIIVVNPEGNIIDEIDTEKLYIQYQKTRGYTFIGNMKKTIILDNENKKVAILDATRKGLLIGNKLIDAKDNRLSIIDLSSIFNKKVYYTYK